MKLKLTHLVVLVIGVLATISLSFLPKFVVNDKEKSLRETENKVRQELTISSEPSHTNSSSIAVDLDLSSLKEFINSLPDTSVAKLEAVDSLATLYRDAFALDSSALTYLKYGRLNKQFYLWAIKDAITGFRMNSSGANAQSYSSLCENVLKEAKANYPDDQLFQVEQLRYNVYSASLNGTAPMQSILELRTIVQENPMFVEARVAYSEMLTLSNQLEKAIEQYTKVIEIDPNNLQAHVELVSLHLNFGNSSKAKQVLLRLEEINKIDKDSYIQDFIDKNLKKLN